MGVATLSRLFIEGMPILTNAVSCRLFSATARIATVCPGLTVVDTGPLIQRDLIIVGVTHVKVHGLG